MQLTNVKISAWDKDFQNKTPGPLSSNRSFFHKQNCFLIPLKWREFHLLNAYGYH